MSARPRPVTATFKPKSMEPPVKPRSYSLSSDDTSGSTASLLSILNHSSIEDPEDNAILSCTGSSKEGSFNVIKPMNKTSAKRSSTDSLLSVLGHSSCESLSEEDKKSDPSNKLPKLSPRFKEKRSGSTDSLISVLDHDSCDDLQLSDIEQEHQIKPEEKEPQSKPETHEKRKRYRRHTHENVENGMIRHKACMDQIESKQRASTSSDRQPENDTSKPEQDDDGLTPWERWLLHKAKEDRVKVKQEIRKKKKEKVELKKERKEKEAKQKKGEEKFQEWLEKKTEEIKIKSNQSVREQKVKKELEDEKKREIEEKSKVKFDEWASQKKNQGKEKKRKEKEEQERKQKEKEELQTKSEAAYQEWCKKAQNRPKSAQRNTSFGYTSGKLTGYYDTNAYPAPSFYNPLPWQPVEVPRPKSEKTKRPKSKYRWNPNKYL